MDDEEVRKLVGELMGEGHSLNEILNILREKGSALTYLELRMIASEFEEEPEEPEREPEEEEEEEPGPQMPSGVSVAVDAVAKPGVQLSGTASLKSGAKVQWFIDAYGRVGLQPEPGSARPLQSDMADLQQALEVTLRNQYGR